VSNHEFYDDRLVVFPSPDAHRGTLGLVFRHLPETVYDRGGTRTNPGEADAVAQAVIEFARAQLGRPEGERLTLGVAAFSTAQREALADRLEALRRDDPTCEPFFAEGTAEPFFVKNLENVQGDERDVIYISVGYGRNAAGRVALNFGPLNTNGGERRLNVLITRARLRCEVFTNLHADDLDLARTSARGIRAFKTFLAYAQNGRVDTPERGGNLAPRPETAAPPLPFDDLAAAALRASGHEVRAGVGSAGFVLDLAIVDPAQPGRYLLGITGDRLRRQVLEGLGWRLHRVWSAAWFRDPQAELERVLDAIEEARAAGTVEQDPSSHPPENGSVSLGSSLQDSGAPAPDRGLEDATPATQSVGSSAEPPAELERSSDPPSADDSAIPQSPATPYPLTVLRIDLRGRDLHEVPASRLARWVAEVVKTEGPVHPSEVARRVMEAAGVKRLGNRIQSTLDLAVEAAVRGGSVRREGEFLWPSGMTDPPVRDRGSLPAPSRRIELIAPEELARAVEQVVADAFGLEPAAIPAATCRLLGFGRSSDEMRRRVDEVVQDLVARKRLELRGDHVIAGEAGRPPAG
jgi:hypothetical protein